MIFSHLFHIPNLVEATQFEFNSRPIINDVKRMRRLQERLYDIVNNINYCFGFQTANYLARGYMISIFTIFAFLKAPTCLLETPLFSMQNMLLLSSFGYVVFLSVIFEHSTDITKSVRVLHLFNETTELSNDFPLSPFWRCHWLTRPSTNRLENPTTP